MFQLHFIELTMLLSASFTCLYACCCHGLRLPVFNKETTYRKSPDKRRVPDTGRGDIMSCLLWKRVERRRHLVGRRTKWVLEVQEEENAMICRT